MIVIRKDTTNLFEAPLLESVTIDDPYYLARFTSEDTKDEYFIVLTDTSSFPTRYQLFSLELPTELDLEIRGDYRVDFWEQASDSNLDPDNADGFLKSLRCKVIGAVVTSSEADETNDQDSVYERQ